MLNTVVVMFKSIASVVGRINVNALDLACVFLLESFEREKIVAMNKHVVKNIIIRHSFSGMITLCGILNKNPRLQPRPLLLPHPNQL